MAWIEKIGRRSWRVRYRTGGHEVSASGFYARKAAVEYVDALACGREPRRLPPPVTLGEWAVTWFAAQDVATRTGENYRSLYRNHIEPRWGERGVGDITGMAVAEWAKTLREAGYAQNTVSGITKLLSTMLADAADEHLIAGNPIRHRHRGRRHITSRVEVVWPSAEEALAVAAQAALLSSVSDGLLMLTAGWSGARWGELVGLQQPNLHVDDGLFVVDPEIGALHEGAGGRMWLGPPKTDASARTVLLPPFLVDLLRLHVAGRDNPFVFTTVTGAWHRRSNFCRRVMRPAADGNLNCRHRRIRVCPVMPGLRFHGFRHGHKTWMIDDQVPEVAQAARLGHVLQDRMRQTYSHVARSMEQRLLEGLQARYINALATAPSDVLTFLDAIGNTGQDSGLRDWAA